MGHQIEVRRIVDERVRKSLAASLGHLQKRDVYVEVPVLQRNDIEIAAAEAAEGREGLVAVARQLGRRRPAIENQRE
jgi:hypothetical protein